MFWWPGTDSDHYSRKNHFAHFDLGCGTRLEHNVRTHDVVRLGAAQSLGALTIKLWEAIRRFCDSAQRCESPCVAGQQLYLWGTHYNLPRQIYAQVRYRFHY
jgi:hypothetical protein